VRGRRISDPTASAVIAWTFARFGFQISGLLAQRLVDVTLAGGLHTLPEKTLCMFAYAVAQFAGRPFERLDAVGVDVDSLAVRGSDRPVTQPALTRAVSKTAIEAVCECIATSHSASHLAVASLPVLLWSLTRCGAESEVAAVVCGGLLRRFADTASQWDGHQLALGTWSLMRSALAQQQPGGQEALQHLAAELLRRDLQHFTSHSLALLAWSATYPHSRLALPPAQLSALMAALSSAVLPLVTGDAPMHPVQVVMLLMGFCRRHSETGAHEDVVVALQRQVRDNMDRFDARERGRVLWAFAIASSGERPFAVPHDLVQLLSERHRGSPALHPDFDRFVHSSVAVITQAAAARTRAAR
jgi:hypothetical protein